MKLKKFLATVMAVALAVSPMTVSANSEVTAPGSTEFDVDGDTTYVDTTKYKVTLPTSQGLKFTMDPSGIFGYVQANQGATNFTEDDIASYAGKIVGVGAHNIVNKSSVPVAVTCDYKLSTTASDVSFSTATNLTPDTISGNQINLVVVGGKATVSGNNVTGFTEGADGFKKGIGTDSTEIMVLLDKASYQYTVLDDGTFDYVHNPGGSTPETSAALSVKGCISKDHDWSELAGSNGKKVKLSCVFSFKGVKDSSGATADDCGFVTAGADTIEFLDGSAGALTGTYSKRTGGAYDTTLGEATKVVMTAKPGSTGLTTILNTDRHYTNKDGKCLLKTAWVSTLPNGEYTFEITSGAVTKIVKLTVTD